jgi:integrase
VEAADALLRQGMDPLAERDAQKQAAAVAIAQATTFAEAAERFIASHQAAWRNAKHRQQWRNTLSEYAFPVIGHLAVAVIDAAAVLRVLTPIWTSRPETASRLRGRIEAVLDYARVQGWTDRDRPNPAQWRGNLALTLPAKGKVRPVRHHAALDWQEMPVFMAELRQRDSVGARCLEFAILSAARSSEVRLARWSEIDLRAALWTVPPSRMKAARQHRVPLSDAALRVLKAVAPLSAGPDSLIFPGMKRGRPLSDMSLGAVLKRLGRGDLTAHGFRSSFRDWCAETGQASDVAEAALAHVVGDKTVAAYQRGDLLDRRRRLMEAWQHFAAPA